MRCVKMDNLDHSMHIAECDWTVFYEESEECDLSRPPLVCHDSSNLSESEDSGNSSPVCSTGRKGPGPDSGAANRGEVGSSAAGCCVEESNYSGCEKYTSRHVIQGGAAAAGGGEDDDLATKAEMHLAPSVAAQHIARDPDDGTGTTVPTERGNDRRSDERQPELEGEDGDVQMEGDVGDPPSGTGAAIDVNEWRAGEAGVGVGVALRGEKERWFVTVNVRRPRAVPVKKRRKRNHKDMCGPGQDRSLEGGLELQVMTESCDFQGGADSEDVTTENQTQVKKSAEEDPESTRMGILSGASVMSLTPGALDGLSEELVAPRFPTRSLSEPMTSAESAESEEFEDVGGFSSTHSSDSESYLSAAESLEELAVERRHSQGSSPPRGNQNLSTLTVITGDAALSPRVTAANSKGHQRADPTLTFPSAVPSVDKLPGDNDTPWATRSALGCSPGDRLLSVPDLRVTPCCEADCPETYAEAAGRARPVYAISAFWDEMEKLTINDILQLRTGGSGPPGERSLCDGGVTDVSSAADSDYFTQPDESKPDRSSWDFSTSDGKEEHSSGSLGPDPKGEKQQCTSDAGEEEEEEEESSTGNEGKATPAPSEDIERKRPEDEDSKAFISRRRARPRQIRKCQSRPNVRALSTEDLSVRLLLGDDGSSRFLEAERLSAPTPLMDGLYEIVFPEVFQDALGEEETKGDFRCVSPVVDFPLWTFRDEMPFFSLHDFQRGDEKPIPIFSSSRPAVRDLTFPSAPWVFFSEDDHFSPARVLSRSFVHGSDCWRSLSRRIRFRDKGGSRRGTPCSRAFPVAVEKSADPPFTALTEGRVSPAPSQLFRELAGQQRVWEAFRTTRREGIFSTLKQSDMCLVCIAFASWVLKSSDPDGADAWKAAVLANVSALSAIQYLRHYVKKKNPS